MWYVKIWIQPPPPSLPPQVSTGGCLSVITICRILQGSKEQRVLTHHASPSHPSSPCHTTPHLNTPGTPPSSMIPTWPFTLSPLCIPHLSPNYPSSFGNPCHPSTLLGYLANNFIIQCHFYQTNVWILKPAWLFIPLHELQIEEKSSLGNNQLDWIVSTESNMNLQYGSMCYRKLNQHKIK